ncbi:acetate--CoA ligase family protein [Solirubrobacter sp. CPCC 204708]|uniref:Acetate--CoA ligase family protein n=1 Tax=Solirubrobacter deserti TaxID=2282478 RepID=A0ABT4RC81_9ACTN|nr:CoA-binding protein [Solirubrobacter deserti]MBE2315491.1 acetate--CoA ligase family protein [Solirubrobacter deserti]MDA0136130.1 acetate--CoA ligase family protein [Solirubrobacter deserti]
MTRPPTAPLTGSPPASARSAAPLGARLFAPRSVAVVGASERAGSYGGEVLLNLARIGYGGRVFAVNPRRSAVHGVAAVPSLDDLPQVPDAVVVAVPAADATDVVARAASLGCGGAVVFAAGFAEVRARGLQARLVAAADGMPVCGPNGNGIVSLPDRVALWGDPIRHVEPGPVALISQSGNVAVNALASRRGLRLHTVISCGNQAVVDAADFLLAVAQREGVRSVALYVEDDGDGPRWCTALEACARAGVRVAVLKAGSSRAGRAAAEAHTGAIAGDQRVFRAVFEECGAAWAEDPHDLLEIAKALAMPARRPSAGAPPAPQPGAANAPAAAASPRGVAVMTCSGGDSAVAADLAASLGVDLPALAPDTITALERHLPAAATAGNPLDYTALLWEDTAALTALIEALGADPAIGRVLVLFDAYDGHAPIVDAVAQARAPTLLASTIPELMPEDGVAGLRSGLLAARALTVTPDPERIAQLERPVDKGAPIPEHEAKQLLRAAGVPVPEGRIATDAEDAERLARELGPVAMKATRLRHKAAAGGVELNVRDVREAFARGLTYIERMTAPGLELLVSVDRTGFMPVLVVGLGGTHTELLDRATIVPLPAPRERIEPRVADIAHTLQQLPLALIELNPVIVTADGAVAVDALADEEAQP